MVVEHIVPYLTITIRAGRTARHDMESSALVAVTIAFVAPVAAHTSADTPLVYPSGVRLRVIHVSDTHGRLPHLGYRGDVVVHSGDFMPNRHDTDPPDGAESRYGTPDREETFQKEWIDRQAKALKAWIGDRLFFFCPGNHDYYDPTARLQAEGVQIINLGETGVEHYQGVPFYGFPYCPSNVHPWTNALGRTDMEKEIERMKKDLRKEKDIILVAHCPPGGVLDKNRQGALNGNPCLTDFINYSGVELKAVLCGHVHADHGILVDFGLVISNAATTVHNFVFDFDD